MHKLLSDLGENWPQLIESNQSKVKVLDPRELNKILVNPFSKECDEFWSHYIV